MGPISNKTRKIAVNIVAAFLVLLFVYAGLSKLLDYQKFRVDIGKSPMLTAFAHWIAWVVPGIEFVISLLLMTKRFRLFALYASFSLMIVFTAYIIAILKFSDFIPCSCGGILQNMTWKQHLFFNCIYILIPLIGILAYRKDSIVQASLAPATDR